MGSLRSVNWYLVKGKIRIGDLYLNTKGIPVFYDHTNYGSTLKHII